MTDPTEMTHVECALHLLSMGEQDAFTSSDLIAAAQVHATLALVEAVQNWQPPAPPDDDSGVTPEEFEQRWR